jgi:hypothetical protein
MGWASAQLWAPNNSMQTQPCGPLGLNIRLSRWNPLLGKSPETVVLRAFLPQKLIRLALQDSAGAVGTVRIADFLRSHCA